MLIRWKAAARKRERVRTLRLLNDAFGSQIEWRDEKIALRRAAHRSCRIQ